MMRKNAYYNSALQQWSPPFPMLQPFITVPHVAVTPNHSCYFITNFAVMNCDVNAWYVSPVKRSFAPNGLQPTGLETPYSSIYLKLKTCKTILLLMKTKTYMIMLFKMGLIPPSHSSKIGQNVKDSNKVDERYMDNWFTHLDFSTCMKYMKLVNSSLKRVKTWPRISPAGRVCGKQLFYHLYL